MVGERGAAEPSLSSRKMSHRMHVSAPYSSAPAEASIAASACKITSVTACGCEIMIMCEPSTSRAIVGHRRVTMPHGARGVQYS